MTSAQAGPSAPEPPFFGRVVSVTAGSGLIVRRGDHYGQRRDVQVVLAFLSIPAGQQPYAERAHAILKTQLLDRRVSVRPIGEARDDYVLGLVYVGSENFNRDFLARGHAWVDPLQPSHPAWKRLQQRAQSESRGLFANPRAIHPRQWVEELRRAQWLVASMERIQRDVDVPTMMSETFVGNRSRKVYVPLRCVQTWSRWRASTMVPLLTPAGAHDSGFRRIDCS